MGIIEIITRYIIPVIVFITSIIAIVVGILSIRKSINRKNRKIILYHSVLIIGFFLLTFSTYYLISLKGNESNLLITEKIRWEFQKIKDEATYTVFVPFSNYVNPSDTIKTDINHVLKKARKIYYRLSYIDTTNLEFGFKIFRYDNLTYLAIVIASLEQQGNTAISWADSCILNARKTLNKIDILESMYSKNRDEYKDLFTWIIKDNFRERNRYLISWAYAIKLKNVDFLTLGMEDYYKKETEKVLIDSLSINLQRVPSMSYFNEYPLSGNKDFTDIARMLDEEILRKYYLYNDTYLKYNLFKKK